MQVEPHSLSVMNSQATDYGSYITRLYSRCTTEDVHARAALLAPPRQEVTPFCALTLFKDALNSI